MGRMLSDASLEMARTLVRMNTVSRESNLELIHFARDGVVPVTLGRSGNGHGPDSYG